jgi:hypothetical protein
MIEVARRESQARLQVVRLEIRHFVEDLGGSQACREEVENVAHTNSHPADARPAPALLGVYRDSISNLVHTRKCTSRCAESPIDLASSFRYEGSKIPDHQ